MARQARLTMMGEVASMLAHELNQPLAAVASYGAGALNALTAARYRDVEVLDALEHLGSEARHAARIVQRIRAYLTHHKPQIEPCEINEVVRRALAMLARKLARHGIVLEARYTPTLPPVLADAVLIEQVVANLVRNAIEALATATPAPARVVVATRLDGARGVHLEVTDNGPGLSGRDLATLCAPFYSTKHESMGMGMGLAICRSIVEAHLGRFEADEAAGGGACFAVTLPLATVAAAENLA
jgi:two-component system sensor histidine kinase DctS